MITLSAGTILLTLLAVLLGAVLTLIGTALGGLLVYRTKLPKENLFQIKPESGDAFVLDDYGEDDGKERQARGVRREAGGGAEEDVVPGIISKQTERFLNQLKERGKDAT